MASLASQRGCASLLANRSRVMAGASGWAPPGQVSTGLGNDRRALPRSNTPPGFRGYNYETMMPSGRRCRDDSPRAVDASTPIATRGGDMAGVRRYERTQNTANPTPALVPR